MWEPEPRAGDLGSAFLFWLRALGQGKALDPAGPPSQRLENGDEFAPGFPEREGAGAGGGGGVLNGFPTGTKALRCR